MPNDAEGSALRAHLSALPPTAVLYTDFDGTLLGPGGSLLAGPDGRPSARAAQALVDAARAGLTVVPVSGRKRPQLAHDARLLGFADFVAEAGAVVQRAGELHYEWGACPRDLAANPHDALVAAGAVDLLLSRFAGDLRPYEPWHLDREGGHLLHGDIDVAVADALLDEAGLGWCHVIDNGDTGGWPDRDVRAYHLLPRGVGKAQAVADDLRARGIPRAAAAACGDSPTDLALAEVTGTYGIVANGHGEPGGNVFRLSGAMGHGVAELVEALLSAR